ncbi:MAG: hypothetical protein Q7T55_08455, partial [Solirubrobacteraceae bacterium]|nr:hypothetical protein [Solirubrobacteraceae bacterium]
MRSPLSRARRRSAVLSLPLLVSAATFGVLPVAASADELRACVKKTTGDLRLVKAGARCQASERIVVWNIEGEAGKNGAAGTPGTAGSTGPAGPPGATGPAGPAG